MEFNDDDDDESNSYVDTLSANSTCVYKCIRNIPIEDSALQQVGLYMTIVFANAVISACIGLSGFLLNLINILVFVKMGFGEFTNVSLLSLSMADAGALLFFLPRTLFCTTTLTPKASDKELMIYVAVTTPHVCFAEISGICTVFLALERFICIAVPHRVKSLMTI
ncbi:lysophosphatidic acid receptor 6 [Biomphalaria pfeifferi]|uniref:Lysophosphatidic acid receptor 6 n=1 Tax=Biomphalaria pfeifferi TaxID=112525 RepID=A0AAD8BTB1_BIOPF|nr:lysophosphatidic acid receptor 6 [Biomphalaria pfeifferi]